MTFKSTLHHHWVAFIFALIIIFFMVGPEFIMRASLGDSFGGIYMHGSDGELFYLARMQQTYRDISAWDSPFLYEYRGEFPLTYALFADAVLGYPGKWLGIPVPEMNLIYKTIFSGAIFLLIYSLIFRLTANRWWSITGAILIMAGYRLSTLPGIMDFLTWRQNHSQFLLFSRPPTSQATWVIFWSFLHVFLSALRKRECKYFLGCGVIFGLSFYSQFFLWTFLLALIGIIVMAVLWMRQWKLIGQILIILGVGLIIAIPYITNLLDVVGHDLFSFYGHMTLLVESRELYISKMGLVVAVFFLFYFKIKKSRNIDDMLMLALLVTTFVSTNQQVITNRLLEVGHYHWFFNIFIFILIIFYLARWASNFINQKWIKLALFALVLFSFLNGYLIQSSSYAAQSQKVSLVQKYFDVFQWLDQNISPESVVLTNNDYLSSLLSVYAHNFVYWHPTAPLYMMPPERFETSFFIYLKLGGISPAMLGGESFFHSDPNRDQFELASKNPNIASMLAIQYRQAFQDGMLNRYELFYNKEWSENFKKFRLDYVLYDPAVLERWDLGQLKFLKPIKSFGNIIVYENMLAR